MNEQRQSMGRMRKVSGAVWWKQRGEAVVTEAAVIAKRGSFKVRNMMRSRSTEVQKQQSTHDKISQQRGHSGEGNVGAGDHTLGHGRCCRRKRRSCGRKREIVRNDSLSTIKMHTTINSHLLFPR
jgi:hypothetical protein